MIKIYHGEARLVKALSYLWLCLFFFYSSNHCQESRMDERLGYYPPLLQTSRNILTSVNNSSPIFCTLWEFLRRCKYIMPCSVHQETPEKDVAHIKLVTSRDYARTILKEFFFFFFLYSLPSAWALFISTAIHIWIKIIAMIQTFLLVCIIKLKLHYLAAFQSANARYVACIFSTIAWKQTNKQTINLGKGTWNNTEVE